MDNLNYIIESTIRTIINEHKKREILENIISEEIKHMLNEKKKKKKKSTKKNDDSGYSQALQQKKKQIRSILKDPKYNHAQIAYELYKPKDQGEKDAYRSKLSKKLRGILNLNNKEINKLDSIIRKT